jgi:CRP/FNR family transcriptional regulator
MDLTEAAGKVILFHGLPRPQLEAVARIAQLKRAPRGQEIFRHGDPAEGFYAVAEGKVKVFRASPLGKEQILHVFGPGESFGEIAVFERGVFPAGAQALADSQLLFFPRKAFSEAIRKDPELAMNMMALLATRLRQLVRKVEEIGLKEVPSRLAAYLLGLAREQEREQIRLDIPKGQIALSLGASQETLSRTLKRFAERGLLRVKGRDVALLDRAGLERLAQGERFED